MDKLIKRGGPEYPHCLLDLPNPPEQLYARGRLELLTRPAVAIVGTRDCTRYGTGVAKELAKTLAENGICVVSGLAGGIDTAAHIGALDAGSSFGGTIAVLGNGFDYSYPVENYELQQRIGRAGLLLTEYPPDFHGNKETFPQRNRIVAALSRAVAVIEADVKSGTMITVRIAKKLKREVFAVPGSILSYASRGTNKLIKEKTARILTDEDEILKYMGSAAKGGDGGKPVIIQIGMDEKTVLDILGQDEVHMDELIEKSKLEVNNLMTLLTNMELSGLIEKLPGNMVTAGRR
jgi:DNA processing protein